MNRFSRYFLLFSILAGMLVSVQTASSQSSGSNWIGPYRVSNLGHKTIGAGTLHGMEGAEIAVDQNGIAHVFWRETDGENRTLVQYARFDGINWSIPINIHATVPDQAIGFLSAAVDRSGVLYLMWGTSTGSTSPVFMSQVFVNEAHLAQEWTKPIAVGITAFQIKLRVDSDGILHIIYSQIHDANPGIYYVRSEDEGKTWSYPVWLDSDILKDHVPWSLQFVLDSDGGLHVAWYYYSYEVQGDWIRYVHSLDSGKSWASPMTLDRAGASQDRQLAFAAPVLAVKDKTILMVWAGGRDLSYRNFAYSSDRGLTWTQPVHIFGDLNGQAGDGVVADSSGTFHYFGQVRYPQGIWQVDWMNDRWTAPFLVYFMTEDSSKPLGNHLNAHDTHPAIVAGNILLLVFFDREGDEGHEPLYAMHRVLEGISSVRQETEASVDQPSMTAAETQEMTPAIPTLESTPENSSPGLSADLPSTRPSGKTSPAVLILLGIVPSVLLITIFLVRYRSRRRPIKGLKRYE